MCMSCVFHKRRDTSSSSSLSSLVCIQCAACDVLCGSQNGNRQKRIVVFECMSTKMSISMEIAWLLFSMIYSSISYLSFSLWKVAFCIHISQDFYANCFAMLCWCWCCCGCHRRRCTIAFVIFFRCDCKPFRSSGIVSSSFSLETKR